MRIRITGLALFAIAWTVMLVLYAQQYKHDEESRYMNAAARELATFAGRIPYGARVCLQTTRAAAADLRGAALYALPGREIFVGAPGASLPDDCYRFAAGESVPPAAPGRDPAPALMEFLTIGSEK